MGAELWCNMEGQYAHIIADLGHLAGDNYHMSICSLGIMGTEYARREQIPETISVSQGQKLIKIFSQLSSLELIGTKLQIEARQPRDNRQLDFVSFKSDQFSLSVEIDASCDLPTGEYILYIESFNGLSDIKSTLKLEKVTIIVTQPIIKVTEQPEIEPYFYTGQRIRFRLNPFSLEPNESKCEIKYECTESNLCNINETTTKAKFDSGMYEFQSIDIKKYPPGSYQLKISGQL